MKKLALILAFMIIPCTAFSLEMLNDDSMDAITGQSGVHIAVDDIELFINIDKLAYIDCDGYDWRSTSGCSGAAGAIYIGQFQMDTLTINAILTSDTQDDFGAAALGGATTQTGYTVGGPTPLYSASCGNVPLQYNYGNTNPMNNACWLNTTGGGAPVVQTQGLDNLVGKLGVGFFRPSAITIDVTDDLPAISEAYTDAMGSSFGGVLIGLPTVELHIGSMTITPTYTGDVNGLTSNAYNNNENFGTFVIEGVTVAVLSGWVEIGPH